MNNFNELCNDSTLMEALLLLKSSDPPSPNLIESESMNVIENEFFNPLMIIEDLPDHAQLTLLIIALQFESTPQSVNQLCLSSGLTEWPNNFIESYEMVINVIETLINQQSSSIDSEEVNDTKRRLNEFRVDIARYKSTEHQHKRNLIKNCIL